MFNDDDEATIWDITIDALFTEAIEDTAIDADGLDLRGATLAATLALFA